MAKVSRSQVHKLTEVHRSQAIIQCLIRSECARPSRADKRCDVQLESVLELRLMSAWRIFLRSRLLHLVSTFNATFYKNAPRWCSGFHPKKVPPKLGLQGEKGINPDV
eukprot:1148673-Pelagomonas_calceolata.AAC.2